MANETRTRYDVCFYQEPLAQISSESLPLFRTGIRLDPDSPSGLSIVQYGLQLVNKGKILTTSNFRGTGDPGLTGERVREYAKALTDSIPEKEEGLLVLIHKNRKFGEKCLHPSESSVDYHVGTLKSTLKRELPMATIRDSLENGQFAPDYYETVVQIRTRLTKARAEANKGKPRPRLVRKNK